MGDFGEAKSARLLKIYARLQNGQLVQKTALAQEFGVTTRSIQRDIESLRCFLAEQMLEQDIAYDHHQKGYRLSDAQPIGLTNGEILAVCKILLDSRSLRSDEMMPILDKLVECCVPEANIQAVKRLLANEKHHYTAPRHGVSVLDLLWELGQAVEKHQVIEIDYLKLQATEPTTRTIEPVGLLFSEYYFYVVGFLQHVNRQTDFENPDDLFPTIYRVDRIHGLRVLPEHFIPAYAKRFQEGEFRKRVQFMYGGKLQTIKFQYNGPSVEAVLDRLPTAEILARQNGTYTISAEVFGKGIQMWLRSQGDYVSMIEMY